VLPSWKISPCRLSTAKSFVHGADQDARGLQHNAVVGVVGYRSARSDCSELRTAPRAQHAVHRIAVQILPDLAAPRAIAFGEHAHDCFVGLRTQVAIRIGRAQHLVELFLVPFARRDLGHDLLGEHVERRGRNHEPVELSPAHRIEERNGLGELVAREREQPRLGYALERMSGAAGALQKGRDQAA
jgi:hypothetical protein